MVSFDTYRVRITSRASEELSQICAYIEKQSPQNAKLVATEIIDAIDSLQIFPDRSEGYDDSSQPGRIIRKMPVLSFVVYYHVIEGERVVEILSIVHGSQLRPTQF